jgi:hypothetical protein
MRIEFIVISDLKSHVWLSADFIWQGYLGWVLMFKNKIKNLFKHVYDSHLTVAVVQ